MRVESESFQANGITLANLANLKKLSRLDASILKAMQMRNAKDLSLFILTNLILLLFLASASNDQTFDQLILSTYEIQSILKPNFSYYVFMFEISFSFYFSFSSLCFSQRFAHSRRRFIKILLHSQDTRIQVIPFKTSSNPPP